MWLLLFFSLLSSASCGEPSSLEPVDDTKKGLEPSTETGEPLSKEQVVPSKEHQQAESLAKGIVQVQEDVTVLRCFLLHQKRVKEGTSPKNWVQPDMDAYEESKDPCAILPELVASPKEVQIVYQQQGPSMASPAAEPAPY